MHFEPRGPRQIKNAKIKKKTARHLLPSLIERQIKGTAAQLLRGFHNPFVRQTEKLEVPTVRFIVRFANIPLAETIRKHLVPSVCCRPKFIWFLNAAEFLAEYSATLIAFCSFPRGSSTLGYSRSARIGSVRDACHAGVKQAPTEITIITSDATIKTAGLCGFT